MHYEFIMNNIIQIASGRRGQTSMFCTWVVRCDATAGGAVYRHITLVLRPKLPFVPYVKQNVEEIARKTIQVLIEQMENSYTVTSHKVPVKLVLDVKYPDPFGVESIKTF